MHHPPLGGTLVVDHAQHVGVRVAVVDDQRLAEPLGQVDVPPERLRPAPPGPSSPVRKWSSPVSPTARTSRARRASRSISAQRVVELAGRREPRRLVGVQRHPGDDAVELVGRLDRPAGASRSQPICTMRGTPTAAAARQRVLGASRLAVRRSRGGSGCRRPGAAAARARAGGRRSRAAPPSPRSPRGSRRALGHGASPRCTASYTSRLGSPAGCATAAIAVLARRAAGASRSATAARQLGRVGGRGRRCAPRRPR